MSDMESLLEVAKQAARRGGDVIIAGADDLSSLNIEQKTLHDYVSEVDYECYFRGVPRSPSTRRGIWESR